MSVKSQRLQLENTFHHFADVGQLSKAEFSKAVSEEVIGRVLKRVNIATNERWNDLVEIGVPNEVWEACFGINTVSVGFKEFESVFETDEESSKSEIEKLVDLISQDEALRNQIEDLEHCLQHQKDMTAASDMLLDEHNEKMLQLEQELEVYRKENKELKAQVKSGENLRNKLKNMDSEYRLLKRDFDLVFATNKSVQKKAEKAELENRTLRKTIVHMASQLEKLERLEKQNNQSAPQGSPSPSSSSDDQSWNSDTSNTQSQHMVWDPAVRSLVPITGENLKNKFHRKDGRRNSNRGSFKNKRRDNGNGRLVSPFPRRYTSSHIPRYRRKYEMNELSRFQSV